MTLRHLRDGLPFVVGSGGRPSDLCSFERSDRDLHGAASL